MYILDFTDQMVHTNFGSHHWLLVTILFSNSSEEEYKGISLYYEIIFNSDWYKQLVYKSQQLAIMKTNSANQPEFLHAKIDGNGFVFTIEVEDVDSLYSSFNQEIVVHKLVTEEWGQRHFIIQAPENILIDVVNHTEPDDCK